MGEPREPNVGRSVSAVGERIQEIIDTAERVAAEIQADAERQAREYLAERRREADRLVESRAAELAEMRNVLTATAGRVEAKTAELVAALDDALARVRENEARAAAMRQDSEPAATLEPTPSPEPAASRPAQNGPAEAAGEHTPAGPGESQPHHGLSEQPQSGGVAEREEGLERERSLQGLNPRPVAYPGSAAGGSEQHDARPEEGEASARMQAVPDQPAERRAGDTEAALLRATQLAVAGRNRDEIEATISSEFDLGDPAAVVDQILGSK